MIIFPSLLAIELDLKGQAVTQELPFAQAGEGGFALFFSNILTALMTIAALAVFIFLIWGAFDYINSGGEKGKIESARNKMTGAVMGLVVLAMVLVIFAFIQQVLGIEILTFSSGPTAPTTIDDGIFGPQNGAAGGRL